MAPTLDISKATTSNMENVVENYEVAALNTDGISQLTETKYTNTMWSTHWGYFNTHPELKSAILMKAIWDVGKGFETDAYTKVILDHITGMGKDTFEDILFNMDVCRYVGRDSFAEIMRDEGGTLINLKPLDPGSIRMIFNSKGILIRYEQFNKLAKGQVLHKFKPNEIFHLSNNRLADQIHGISVIESLDGTLLAEMESFTDTKQLMHRQVKPFIIFKLKTDDTTKIDELVSKIDVLRNKGEDLYIPDDEDILSYEVVQVNPSAMILNWRTEVTNKFYRALGLPLILFGSANSTESGGKMEYFAHEQVFEHSQRYLEKQIWNQLHLKINLIPPQSMAQNLATDAGKDQSASGLPQGLETQPADTTAGVGA